MLNLLAAMVPYIAVLIGMTIFNNAWLAILLYHLGIIIFVRVRKPQGLRQWLLTGWKNRFTLPLALICASAGPIVYFMWPLLHASDITLSEWLGLYGLTGWAWTLMIPYFSIVHPLLEEIHWRKKNIPLRHGYHLLFAGYHVLVLYQLVALPWLIAVFGILAGSSFFWQWAANRFGGCALPVITHTVADTAVISGVCCLLIR